MSLQIMAAEDTYHMPIQARLKKRLAYLFPMRKRQVFSSLGVVALLWRTHAYTGRVIATFVVFRRGLL